MQLLFSINNIIVYNEISFETIISKKKEKKNHTWCPKITSTEWKGCQTYDNNSELLMKSVIQSYLKTIASGASLSFMPLQMSSGGRKRYFNIL